MNETITKVIVALLAITVRRDANTITPVTVPSYEVAVLKNIFGKENVTSVSNAEVLQKIEVDPESEYERLCSKYGSELIAKIFGEDDGARLTELVLAAEVEEEEAKKPKKGTKPSNESA